MGVKENCLSDKKEGVSKLVVSDPVLCLYFSFVYSREVKRETRNTWRKGLGTRPRLPKRSREDKLLDSEITLVQLFMTPRYFYYLSSW